MRGHHIVQSVLGSLIVSAFVLCGSAVAGSPVVKASPAIYRESEEPATIDQTGVRYFASYGPYYGPPPGYYRYGYSYGYGPRFRTGFYRPYSYSVYSYSYGVPAFPGYVGSTYVTGYRGYPAYYGPRPYPVAPRAYYGYYRPGYGWYGGYRFRRW
ncbi:hypothetical protein [Maioricimonas sp. JC845]|uniref:hypothetical protein n=1 Tax=Maioricimonas sp. JC845 TaxID=3232138 RepID=UPI00345A06F4